MLHYVVKQEGFLSQKNCIFWQAPALCFNHRAHREPSKPKQILGYYLSHRRFTHHVPVATQQARLARWWKDQARRWADRISRGAWLCENWASLRLTLIAEGSPLQKILSVDCLTWATVSGCVKSVKRIITMPSTHTRQVRFWKQLNDYFILDVETEA